jgi:hypothetical protein
MNDLLTPEGRKANEAARKDTRDQLDAARATLRNLESDTPKLHEVVEKHEAKVEAATSSDARVTARSKLDAARAMLRDHEAAITAQAAEVHRLEHEVEHLDATAGLTAMYAQWERLTAQRETAARELVATTRSKLREVVEMDNQLHDLGRKIRKAAGDAGVPVPAVRPPHRLIIAADAPAPVIQALDNALTAERQVHKKTKRREAKKEQVTA